MFRKAIGLSLVVFGAAAAFGTFYGANAACNPYAHFFTQCDAVGDNNDAFYKDIPAGNADGIAILNGSTHRMEFATFGSNLTWNSGTKVMDAISSIGSPTITNGVTRPINSTAFQPSATKTTAAAYSITISSTLSLSGGQDGTAFLEVSANGSTGWTEVGRVRNGNTGTLTIGLNTVQTQTYQLIGFIPSGYYARIRTANNTGTPTFTYVTGQETVMPY